MRTLLLVLAIAAFALAETTVPSTIAISLINSNLTVNKISYVTLKLCNSLNSILVGGTLVPSAQNVTFLNASVALGNFAPKSCKLVKIYMIPYTDLVALKVMVSAYSPLLKTNVGGTAAFFLKAKAPELVVNTLPLSYPGSLKLNITNIGQEDFTGTIYLYINKKLVSWKKVEVPKKESVLVSVKAPPLPNGTWTGALRAEMGNYVRIIPVIINVVKSPFKLVLKKDVVEYCTPEYSVIRIEASSGIPSPKQVNVKGCGKLKYKVLYPKLPLNLVVMLITPYFTLNKSVTIGDIEVDASTTTLYTSITNPVDIVFKAPIALVGNVEFQSQAPVNPLSAVVKTNGTVRVNIVGSGSQTVLKVIAFGKIYTLNFNVIKFSPVLTMDVEPKTLKEGTVSQLKVCIKNMWNRVLKDLTLSVVEPTSEQLFIERLEPGNSTCLKLNVTVPWGSNSIKVKAYVEGSNFKKEFTFNIMVTSNPSVPIISVSSDKNFLRVGFNNVTITVKNLGKGWARGTKLTFQAPDLVAPTQFYVGNIGPNQSKKIVLKFSVHPGTNREKLTIKMHYCSGMLKGPCKPTEQQFSLLFGVLRYVPPTLQLEAPITIPSGKTQTIEIRIKNIGDAKAIAPTIRLSNGKNIAIIGPNVFVLKDIPPGKEVKLAIKAKVNEVFNPSQGTISYRIDYSDEWGNSYNKQGSIVFNLKPVRMPKIVVNLITGKVVVGNSFIKLLVRNIGSNAARNINVTLYANGIVLKNDTFNIRVLGPKQGTTITVPVFVPKGLAGKSVSLGVAVSYGKKTDTFNYKVDVVLGPQIKITDVNVNPSSIEPGKPASVAFTIANTGDQPAYDVRAEVKLPLQFSALGPSSVMIGVVKPQSVVPAAFLFKAKEVKPGTYPIKIIVTYTYQGVKYKKEVVTTIIVKPKLLIATQGLFQYKTLVLGGAGGLVLLFILFKVLRRKRVPAEGEELDVE